MLKCSNLSKRYPGGHGVFDVNLEVKEHDIFALLGPNGSGKSTLIKMITGLVWPDDGEVCINGYDVHNEHHMALKRVGAIIEWPAFIPYLTARQNLKVFTGAYGKDFESRMTEVVEMVNMASRLDDKVINFSTGMKQRLGLALALLPDSSLVILDEPANGLDPNGIIEIRGLIKEFNRKFGATVFLTSHLLGEVEQICDRMAIIHRGRLAAAGSIQELLGKCITVCISADPAAEAMACLEKLKLEKECPILSLRAEDGRIIVESDRDCSADINALLVGRGIRVSSICQEKQRLESFFMRVTDGETDVK